MKTPSSVCAGNSVTRRGARKGIASMLGSTLLLIALATCLAWANDGNAAGTVARGKASVPSTAAVAALDGKFDPARDAAADLRVAMAEAKRSGRRIILDVGGQWCSWCLRMDTLLHADVALLAARDAGFVWMKVNYSEENENTALLSRYPKIEGYPHLFVLDANGKLLHSQTTEVFEQGNGYDRAKFLQFFRKWAPKRK